MLQDVKHMKKYPDCENKERNCFECSLSSYGRDCHNNKINKLSVYRAQSGITQVQLAEMSGVNERQIKRYESGSSDLGNMTLRNAVAIAKALGITAENLL